MNQLFDKFAEYLLINCKYTNSTIAAYKLDIRKFLEYLKISNTNDLKRITRERVTDFLDNLGEKYSEYTVSRSLTSIKKYFEFLKVERIIEENNIKGIPSKIIPVKAPLTISEEVIRKVIDGIDAKSQDGLRDKAIIDVLFSTGVKASELINLQIGNYDSVNMSLSIKENEKKIRYLRLNSQAIPNLNKYLSLVRRDVVEKTGSTEEAIFIGRYGRKITRNWVWKIVDQRFVEAGLKAKITPQVLRNSFAENALKRGMDIGIIQEALGHTRKHITNRKYVYTKRK